MTMPVHVLSESDLMLLDSYSPELVEQDQEKLKKILFTNGMDTRFPVELTTPLFHRNLRHQVVENGRLFVGTERGDRAWCETGCMSLQAVVVSSEDPEHIKDLNEMATRARFKED